MSTTTTMTIEQFRATGEDRPDVRRCTGEEEPGREYISGLYILRRPGGWMLELDRSEFSGDLPQLEEMLYEYACAEGWLDL